MEESDNLNRSYGYWNSELKARGSGDWSLVSSA